MDYYYCSGCKNVFDFSDACECEEEYVRLKIKKDGFYAAASALDKNTKSKELVKLNLKSSNFVVNAGIVYEKTFG